MVAVDPANAVSPFRQVYAQLATAIAVGELAPGERLPTVRALAADLQVAPGTVARAYRELESAGIIETRGRGGSFVPLDADPVRRRAQELASAFVMQVTALGLPAGTAVELVREAARAAR